jgi:hypothetical protein
MAALRNSVADEADPSPVAGVPTRLLPPGGLRRGEGRFIVQRAGESPSTDSLDDLVHHFDPKDELDAAWAARPLKLVREHSPTVLALEEAGGEPLVRLLKVSIEIGPFSNSRSPLCGKR